MTLTRMDRIEQDGIGFYILLILYILVSILRASVFSYLPELACLKAVADVLGGGFPTHISPKYPIATLLCLGWVNQSTVRERPLHEPNYLLSSDIGDISGIHLQLYLFVVDRFARHAVVLIGGETELSDQYRLVGVLF